MSKLIPVIYRDKNYPHPIEANVYEISGNFDKEEFVINHCPYSLHTDSASQKKTFNSKIIHDLEHIISAQKDGIPLLWYDKDWADDFFKFIVRLIGKKNSPPKVLEIHPPFNNYPIFKDCRLSARRFNYDEAFKIFLGIFDVFYKQFKREYRETKILIENRGTSRAGRFLLSRPSDVLEFAYILSNSDVGLKIVLDYPQIFSALYIDTNIKKKKELQQKGIMIDDEIIENIISFNFKLKKFNKTIKGIHMWGKCKDKNGEWVSHAGNFDTFFSNNKILKKKFLNSVFSTFNDNVKRYFVPEVNSGEDDLYSIVADMQNVGFKFIPNKVL